MKDKKTKNYKVRPWSNEEILFLETNIKQPAKWLSKRLNRTVISIHSARHLFKKGQLKVDNNRLDEAIPVRPGPKPKRARVLMSYKENQAPSRGEDKLSPVVSHKRTERSEQRKSISTIPVEIDGKALTINIYLRP